MKPEFLYHGSPQELEGKTLLPKQAKDLGERSENLHRAVYATEIKNIAITMAILSSKGVIYSGLNYDVKNKFGVIYDGWPEQEYIYLYTLPSASFKHDEKGTQWYSKESVKPFKVEKLKIKDYISFIRKSTDEERKSFLRKYNLSPKSSH
jgi:hypothetical protein